MSERTKHTAREPFEPFGKRCRTFPVSNRQLFLESIAIYGERLFVTDKFLTVSTGDFRVR